jgi:hypothetical protein
MATSEHPPNYLRAWFAGVQLKPSHSVAQTHLLNRWEFSLSSLKSMVPLAAFVCPFGCTEPTAGKHAEIFLRYLFCCTLSQVGGDLQDVYVCKDKQ